MNIVDKIRSAFARKKPAEVAAATQAAATTEPGPKSVPIDGDPVPSNVLYIYSHGFTNGVFQIEPEKESFERFLEFCNKSDQVKEQQLLNRTAIIRTEEKLDKMKAAHAADTEILVEKGKMAESLEISIDELEKSKLKMEQKETELGVSRIGTIAEYSWVPALLFLLAGITFIAADISITKQITSWGFNMTGTQGWIYAIGLAFTAFLIKPTIDRILERPFQTGGFKLRNLYKGVLIGVTVLGLVMLWFLGNFRSDSERARIKLDDLTNKMATMTDPFSLPYRALQNQYDEIQKSLDENSMGQRGLVLSGLLFALGGAICLSVAFGSLKQLINRYWILPWKIHRIKGDIRGLRKEIVDVRLKHSLTRAEQEKAEKRLVLSEVVQLQEELNKLIGEQSALLEAFYQAQFERERALYSDGRSRGEKYTLDGDLLYKVSGNDRSSLYVGKQNGASEVQAPATTRPYTRRPFVKMRKMIADNFNKNQNNQTYDDGTEFEIVS